MKAFNQLKEKLFPLAIKEMEVEHKIIFKAKDDPKNIETWLKFLIATKKENTILFHLLNTEHELLNMRKKK